LSWSLPAAGTGRAWASGQAAVIVRGAPPARRSHRLRPRSLAASEPPPERSSYESSPDWTKSVVGGLTSLVNGVMGGNEVSDPVVRKFERITSDHLLEGIREDFEERQYLWSGDIDVELYDEACTFTDPTLSFQGLNTFITNLQNLRPILDTVVPEDQRKCILHSLSREESGKVVAEWTMVGDLALPWSPRIELGGRTTYTPGSDGRIVDYNERWDISAAEALGQILRPREAPKPQAEHWSGRLDGAPPPKPEVVLEDAPTFVVLPGFGNDAIDYVEPLQQDSAVGLVSCLQRRGCSAVTSPVERINWLLVFINGLMDEDFRAGNGTASGAFGWYLDKAQRGRLARARSAAARGQGLVQAACEGHRDAWFAALAATSLHHGHDAGLPQEPQ